MQPRTGAEFRFGPSRSGESRLVPLSSERNRSAISAWSGLRSSTDGLARRRQGPPPPYQPLWTYSFAGAGFPVFGRAGGTYLLTRRRFARWRPPEEPHCDDAKQRNTPIAFPRRPLGRVAGNRLGRHLVGPVVLDALWPSPRCTRTGKPLGAARHCGWSPSSLSSGCCSAPCGRRRTATSRPNRSPSSRTSAAA